MTNREWAGVARGDVLRPAEPGLRRARRQAHRGPDTRLATRMATLPSQAATRSTALPFRVCHVPATSPLALIPQVSASLPGAS